MIGLTHDPAGKPPLHEMKPVSVRGSRYSGEARMLEFFETQPAGYSLQGVVDNQRPLVQGRVTREDQPLNGYNPAGEEFTDSRGFRFRVRYDGV